MLLSLAVIEGQNVREDTLRSVSLGNAKQLVVGNASGFGVLLHIAAESSADLSNALHAFAQVPDVTGVVTLALRTSQLSAAASRAAPLLRCTPASGGR